MEKFKTFAGLGVAGLLVLLALGPVGCPSADKDVKKPTPARPAPLCPGPNCPEPKPKPRRPWGDLSVVPVGTVVIGGETSPDGTEVITCDLPQSEKKKNVGGRDGSGLCVFTSVEYAARYQNERRLFDFQQKMRQEIGGGWPDKLARMIEKYGPGTQYVQHTGGDPTFLKAAMKSSRMVGVTYDGRDPHYGPSNRIAHMVDLVHLSDRWAAISDNNFPEDNQIVWMTPEEFYSRWRGNSGGWAVVLLNPPPPPVPVNK